MLHGPEAAAGERRRIGSGPPAARRHRCRDAERQGGGEAQGEQQKEFHDPSMWPGRGVRGKCRRPSRLAPSFDIAPMACHVGVPGSLPLEAPMIRACYLVLALSFVAAVCRWVPDPPSLAVLLPV